MFLREKQLVVSSFFQPNDAWEAKEKEEDFVERCFETTSALRDCMLKDPEYYGPMVGENEGNDGEDGDGEKAKEEAAAEA